MPSKPAKKATGPKKRFKKYEVVAQDLIKRIERGDYHKKLPGILLLSDDLGSNPMTVGNAIKLLVEKGILYRIPKSGTYVQDGGRKRLGVIALLVSDINAPLTSQMLASISEVANEKKLSLTLFNHLNNPNQEEKFIKEIVRNHACDGAIWFPSSLDALVKWQGIFEKGNLPFMIFGAPYVGVDELVVATDPFAAFRSLSEHLVGEGYKRLLYITDRRPQKVSELSPRYLGYRSVLESHGLEIFRPVTVGPDFITLMAPEQQAALAREFKKHDALVCAHDRLAVKVYQLLLKFNIRCPEDIGLVGYDGLPYSEDLGITTYAQPTRKIGRMVLLNLMTLIENPEANVESTLLQGELIVRESSSRNGTAKNVNSR